MSRRRSGISLDPALEDQLTLSTFKGKFDLSDFVGIVSEKSIQQAKEDTGPFDPKPFIHTFEAVVDQLIAVRKDVQAKTEQMEKSVRIAEREYSKKMNDLNRGFESVGSNFSGMEGRMNEVSSTAIRIGEQLESVHIERQRAQAACDIIDFYNQFSKGDTSRVDTLRKEGKQGRRQVAILLRRLSTVAKEVDLENADKTRENIEKYCEKFEREMLNLFDRSYRKSDPKMMNHCAQTLLEFNGGNSCVQVYVNQHDFFINNVRDPTKSEDPLLWRVVPDPNSMAPKTEAGLTSLFKEIRLTVETEAQIVKAVFPNPPVVIQVFLQRVFAQSIQQHMEALVHKGTAISDLAYLRVLQLVHSQASSLVEDLKAYELPSMAPRTTLEMNEFRTSSSGSGHTAMSTMLETAMEELFVPYTEGQRYLERESRSLTTLYATLLADFTRYHARSQKGKASIFDRVVNQLSTAAENQLRAAAATQADDGATSRSAQAAGLLMKFGGLGAEKDKEEPLREEDGFLHLEVAEKMLKWHAEAIGRCVELSSTNDVPKHTFSLLRVLSEALVTTYVEAAIETAQVKIESADPKVEPSLQALSVLKTVDLICHLWQQYVNTALLPLASSSVTVRREMVVFNNQSIARLEGGTNILLQRLVDKISAWLSTQLAKQKRTEFKPRDDDLAFFGKANTDPCIASSQYLEKVRDAARASLTGKNREVFLTEVGVSFHSLLLEHFRKFPVNGMGALMLAKDITTYQDTIATFGIPSLFERFEFIRQLGQVWLVNPDVLRSILTEGYLGRIDSTLLKPYLALRSDWGKFEKGFNVDDPEETGSGSTDATTSGAGGLRGKIGRLSVGNMMRDLENLRSEGLNRLGENMTTLQIGVPALPTNFSMMGRFG
ncbi:exocyst complex component Sec10-domain-containing protein [Flagelloscypha sp. PMI_526]|nr:exocyst complex component Sec10-domain-containing protein [Flagelloscypha sp. PMI_526]